MKLNYNEKELHQLLQDFHDLTKLTLPSIIPKENGSSVIRQKKTVSAIISKPPRKVLLSVKLPTVLPLKQQRRPVNVSFTNVMPV